MAITGTHTLLYSSDPDGLRTVLREVLGLKFVDIGRGWQIFALPPSEIAVHPAEGPTFESGTRHQFTLMCDNIERTIRELKSKGIAVMNDPQEERWGVHVTLNLPGNCHVMVYEPRHPVAAGMGHAAAKPARKKTVAKAAKKKATPRARRPKKQAGRRR